MIKYELLTIIVTNIAYIKIYNKKKPLQVINSQRVRKLTPPSGRAIQGTSAIKAIQGNSGVNSGDIILNYIKLSMMSPEFTAVNKGVNAVFI